MKEQDVNFFLTIAKRFLIILVHLPLIIGLLWTIGLCVCRPVCAPLLMLAAVLIISFKSKLHDNFPLRAALSGTVLAAIISFLFLPAPDGVTWREPWERGQTATVTDDTLHIRNVRDFDFHTVAAYDVRYLEEDFNLDELCGVHLIESRHHGLFEDCDLLFSFVFSDGRTLVFGPEMRLPAKEQINSVKALYKCYGLLYVFGTEEDMLYLRTDKRHEYLSFHSLRMTQQQAQNMLLCCIRTATASLQDNEAYPPFAGQYCGPMQDIIRIIHPQLPYTLNTKIAQELFNNDFLASREGETWENYQRRCAVGFDIAGGNRETYSTMIRRRAGAPALPAIPEERHIQEESRTAAPKREIMQGGFYRFSNAEAATTRERTSDSETAAPATPQNKYFQETRFTSGKGSSMAEKIPEPRERLTVDTRDYTDEEYNSDNAEETNATTTSTTDSILEPKARMQADAKAAAAAEEKREKERKDAAMGKFKKKGEEQKEEDVSDVDYAKLFLGRKGSGIKIIEREKEEEEAHPLDPYKRRTPFDKETKKKKTEEEENGDDFTSKPQPLHL